MSRVATWDTADFALRLSHKGPHGAWPGSWDLPHFSPLDPISSSLMLELSWVLWPASAPSLFMLL